MATGSKPSEASPRRDNDKLLWSGLKVLSTGGKIDHQDALREAVENITRNADFEYVAEGRANAVFKVVPRQGDDYLAGWLLRVPKHVDGALPHSYEELQQFRERVVAPKVGTKHLVPQLLVRVPARATTAMNTERDLRSRRKEASSSVAEGYAMLIQDMNPLPWREDIGLEFKPKWLAQSPIAPPDATRCRTCAREAYRNGEKQAEGKTTKPPVCPLGLVASDSTVVLETIKLLTPNWSSSEQDRLQRAFSSSGIFQKLRDLQVQGDSGDTMFTNPQNENFGLAMTLRDCTCFVRMLRAGEGEVEIKLADVDRKNWESKAEYWQHSHTNLVDNGYYHGTETPRMATRCLLEQAV
ncbi:putative Inositol-pentakisphosphate 2-kinase [Seiridium cardinale]|uniref:Inositol-pentakisphosphate 2-kinase n=1 Tax=Seiridium cardinale TaxID=138064 RepID=A0ABR2XKE8_9PEZI